MSEVAEANPIQDLIQNTIDQNYTSANGNFADIMTLKLNDVLDQEKIRLADQIYNGAEDGEGDEYDEHEDEQLELDLDGSDEEVSDESSEDQDTEEDGYEADDETEDQFEEAEDEDEE